MATINFKPRQQATNKVTIQSNVAYGSTISKRWTTGIVLENIKHWNYKTNRVVLSEKKEPNYRDYNKILNELEAHFKKEFATLSTTGNPIDEISLKNIYDGYWKTPAKTKKVQRVILNDLFDLYIEETTSFRLHEEKKTPFAKNTLQNYRTAFALFKQYQLDNNIVLEPKDIDKKFNDELITYLRSLDQLENQRKRERTGKDIPIKYYKETTIFSRVATIKAFLIWAKTEKDVKFPNFHEKHWKVLRPKTFSIALSLEELAIMNNVDLSNYDEEYSKVRDLFIISALCGGMRISASKQLQKANIKVIQIDGKPIKCFDFYAPKTNKFRCVPIHQVALEIIEKYDGEIPSIKSEVVSNELLKKIGKICGFDEVKNYREKRNGDWIDCSKKKYELISNHTARRSFCTNAYELGNDLLTIMAMSGHSSEKVFLNYIKVSEEKHAKRFTQQPFYNIKLDVKPRLIA